MFTPPGKIQIQLYFQTSWGPTILIFPTTSSHLNASHSDIIYLLCARMESCFSSWNIPQFMRNKWCHPFIGIQQIADLKISFWLFIHSFVFNAGLCNWFKKLVQLHLCGTRSRYICKSFLKGWASFKFLYQSRLPAYFEEQSIARDTGYPQASF